MADGNWDGIVGELREGRADMAVSSMTIDEDRSKAINFSVPYMETGITFIVAIREGAISATAFLDHRFSLFRTFWLMWAMLFGAAVTTDTPRGVSSKFMSSIWALFALVFSASYTANLAAFMITKEEYYDLAGMQDWRVRMKRE
ncbi:glutamate receptor ionotropic, NMDA 2D-like [Aplysia californica]|uniref:Glutamate receptor ionotropic, NMDA 2D-like n=1 Tax=Aplysia californica TaxID=6500 RepID=A0ABM1VQ95_APLCA|nr:glutamate receptor ionotropic, NMDA 2D-like [Aplysia californica]